MKPIHLSFGTIVLTIALPIYAQEMAHDMAGMDMPGMAHAQHQAHGKSRKKHKAASSHRRHAHRPSTSGQAPMAHEMPGMTDGNMSQAMPGMGMPASQASPSGLTAPVAQPMQGMPMDHNMSGTATAPGRVNQPMPGMDMGQGQGQTGHEMAGMAPGQMNMTGALGQYSMTRESSGTAWQPDSTPMEGIQWQKGGWMGMTHGYADLVYDHQGGSRGATETFGESMLMVMGQKQAAGGTVGLRGMLSLDPATMPKSGYPLLLQTGETANGRDPLIDRQHPHDAFMELSASYSRPLSARDSAYVYFGLPGEPALGPPTFMHRFSGMDDPMAPITHHWLDSTHITYGVATAGYVHDNVKVEGSVFNGREPDQFRWNIESPRFDSASARVTWNPTRDVSMQVSHGYIHSPESLEPDVNQRRTTASVTYNKAIGGGFSQTTLAWGQNANNPGHTLNAVLAESAWKKGANTFFGRAEHVQKDELFEEGAPQHGQVFNVNQVSLGGIHDFPTASHYQLGLGAVAMKSFVPAAIQPAYGGNPSSVVVFARLKLK